MSDPVLERRGQWVVGERITMDGLFECPECGAMVIPTDVSARHAITGRRICYACYRRRRDEGAPQ